MYVDIWHVYIYIYMERIGISSRLQLNNPLQRQSCRIIFAQFAGFAQTTNKMQRRSWTKDSQNLLEINAWNRWNCCMAMPQSIEYIQPITLPKTNIAPENGPSQKETSIQPIHFQVLVSGRVGFIWPSLGKLSQKFYQTPNFWNR